MEKAKVLVRMVARAFYTTECIVVIDSLVYHKALNVEDLRRIFVSTGRNKQDLLKLIGKLREGGLVSMWSRLETKQNAQKPTNVEYFYIDYRRAIDGTKYRLHMLEEKLRKEAAPAEDKKEYQCSRCSSEWTMMEVIDNADPQHRRSGFLCHRCQFPLDFHPNDPEAAENNGPLGIFNEQFGWLIGLLREIDNVTIPELTGEQAFADRVEVPIEKAALEGYKMETENTRAMPVSVKGLALEAAKVDITIATNSEFTAAEQAAAAEKKARLAEQNSLPEWHTRSTITNEMTAAGVREEFTRVEQRMMEARTLVVDGREEHKVAAESSLDDIFAQLENAARVEMAEQDEEDEEEDDDFEDVMPNAAPEAKKLKVEENGVDSSAAATPATNGVEEDSEDEFEDVA